MKRLSLLICLIICELFQISPVFADSLSDAENLISKAKVASSVDERNEYILQSRNLLKEYLDSNPYDIEALLQLSKTYQITKDRSKAKLYVLKAYNFNPSKPELQKEMGDFYYNFQEYSIALEYYKLALSSGLLTDFDTNLKTAKCYEKLGDSGNAKLYYQIGNHVDSSSREILNKLNEYESIEHEEIMKYTPTPEYVYLFKDKPVSDEEKNDSDAEVLIEEINNL